MRRKTLVVFAALPLAVLLALAGCGGKSGDDHAGVDNGPARTSASPGSVVSIPPVDRDGPTVTVAGVLSRAPSGTCVVLTTLGHQRFMVAGPQADAIGAKVPRAPQSEGIQATLTGHVGANAISACQVGRPFVVDSVRYGR
ncbi:MAG: hypothetical protein ACJ73S_18745 [Mycobacteriales bacterium]